MQKLMRIKEAAGFLNISTSTLYRLTSQNRIPHSKPFGTVYFVQEKLIAWIEENCYPSHELTRGRQLN